jgi:hypothetical protein
MPDVTSTPVIVHIQRAKWINILLFPWLIYVVNVCPCSSHHAHSYSRYSNQHSHLIKNNSWQLINSNMFQHWGAIHRVFIRTKEHKPNILIVFLCSNKLPEDGTLLPKCGSLILVMNCILLSGYVGCCINSYLCTLATFFSALWLGLHSDDCCTWPCTPNGMWQVNKHWWFLCTCVM